MRIVMMRSNPVMPDPRVEKEANSLIGFGYKVKVLAWNRFPKVGKKNHGKLSLSNGELIIRWFNISASYGSGLKNLFPLIFFQMCLLGWLIKHRKEYDVIHACDFDTVIPAWLCSKLFRKKYVYDIFDYYVDAFHVPGLLKPVIEKLDIFMINSADAVIIVNESRKEQISKSRPRQLYVIHNTPDISNVVEAPEITINVNDKPKFAYIGILGEGRFLNEVVEVFQEHPQWELHIGGFGPYAEDIKKIADDYANIFYYGKLPYETVLTIERECDILFAIYDPTVPNHKYSSPNKLYEAMMLGKPIIVAKNTGIDKIVETENLGISIHYSKEDFVKAVQEMLHNKHLWDTYNAKELYNKEYSWSIMTNRIMNLYKKL